MIHKNHKHTFVTIVVSFCAASVPVKADLFTRDPSKICNFLSKAGLSTKGWVNDQAQEFGCWSTYKEIGSGFPLTNNIAFYVEGDRNSVSLVKLLLNINDRTSLRLAHQELINNAAELTVKMTGKQLPQSLKEALEKGRNISQKLGPSTVTVEREDWSTGKGYEIRFIVK